VATVYILMWKKMYIVELEVRITYYKVLALLQDSIDLVTSVLRHLLKTVTLIGCIIFVFGQSYAFLALDLYGGSLLSSGAGRYSTNYTKIWPHLCSLVHVDWKYMFLKLTKIKKRRSKFDFRDFLAVNDIYRNYCYMLIGNLWLDILVLLKLMFAASFSGPLLL
jgi:hypothetical protein